MHGTWLSSTSPTQQVEAWKTVVQPYVASTHLATYNIIGAAPRPRCSEDDVPVKPVIRRNKPSSASSSSSRKVGAAATSKTPVTRENLSKISMACAREEDLDAPFSVPSRSLDRRRTGSQTSISSADLPSITEEEE